MEGNTIFVQHLTVLAEVVGRAYNVEKHFLSPNLFGWKKTLELLDKDQIIIN